MGDQATLSNAVNLIKRSQRILLIGPAKVSIDSTAALLALAVVFERQGKSVDLVITEPTPIELQFLPDITKISTRLLGTRDLTFELDLKDQKVDSVKYDLVDGKLKIDIHPAKGVLDPTLASLTQGPYTADLIMIVGADSVVSIDRLYDVEPELFNTTPVLNLDHQAGNQHYGTLDLVDIGFGSTTELVMALIDQLDLNLITAEVATALLTGVLSATDGLKSPSIKAETFAAVSSLMNLGADRGRILVNLFPAEYSVRPAQSQLGEQPKLASEYQAKAEAIAEIAVLPVAPEQKTEPVRQRVEAPKNIFAEDDESEDILEPVVPTEPQAAEDIRVWRS